MHKKSLKNYQKNELIKMIKKVKLNIIESIILS